MMRFCMASGAGLLGVLVCSLPAMSQPREVGTAVSVVREVVESDAGSNASAARQLKTGDAIIYGRQLVAGQASRGEFELEDETRLVLNENSSLIIDELVLGSQDTYSTVSLKALNGAFRFISGNSPSEAYQISSAVVTMGIRGTAFDVYLGRGDTAAVMLLSGRVRVCRTRGACEELTRRCEIAVSSRQAQSVDKLAVGSARLADVSVSTAFPFAANQSRLTPRFRIRGAEGCVRRAQQIQRRQDPQIQRIQQARAVVPAPPAGEPAPAPDVQPDIADPPAPPAALGNPGTSGRTRGASRSVNSDASERARSDPGQSASSNAGGRKSGHSGSGNGGGSGDGNSKGKSGDKGKSASKGKAKGKNKDG